MDSPIPTEAEVFNALRQVIDPEVGMNIVDLGLVYGVTVEEGHIAVVMTMTSPACPLGAMITDDAKAMIAKVTPPGTDVEVSLVWEPAWTPQRLSEPARQYFGWSD